MAIYIVFFFCNGSLTPGVNEVAFASLANMGRRDGKGDVHLVFRPFLLYLVSAALSIFEHFCVAIISDVRRQISRQAVPTLASNELVSYAELSSPLDSCVTQGLGRFLSMTSTVSPSVSDF